MVAIKDFEMPKNCGDCTLCTPNGLYGGFYCNVTINCVDIDAKERPNDCPLIEIKENEEMLFVNPDCLNKKDAKILKAQVEQQAKERKMLEADYENRLKADMIAMLAELQLEIEELKNEPHCCEHYDRGINNSSNVIQQKIDNLKGVEA